MKEGNFNQQINTESLDLQKRPERAKRLVNFLDRANIPEYLNNIVKGSEEWPDYNEFKSFIVRINGIIRELPSDARGFDGKNVELKGPIEDALMPNHKDKEDILNYFYDSLSKIKKSDLKYALPSVLNALHLFSDGNGRTSRVIHQLLTNHSSKAELNENLEKALFEHGRFDTLDINPGLISLEIEKHILDKYEWEYEDGMPYSLAGAVRIATAERSNFSEDDKFFDDVNKLCKLSRSDHEYVMVAINSAIGDRVDNLFGDYKQKGVISIVKMVEQLNAQDWEKIFDEYYKLKKEHVKTLVDIFVEPDSFQSPEDAEINLKDFFIKKINENYQENKE